MPFITRLTLQNADVLIGQLIKASINDERKEFMFESGRKRAVLHLEERAAHRFAINSALTPADQRINGKHVCILISTCVETSMTTCSAESVISGGRSFVMRDTGIHATVRKRFVTRARTWESRGCFTIVPRSPERFLRIRVAASSGKFKSSPPESPNGNSATPPAIPFRIIAGGSHSRISHRSNRGTGDRKTGGSGQSSDIGSHCARRQRSEILIYLAFEPVTRNGLSLVSQRERETEGERALVRCRLSDSRKLPRRSLPRQMVALPHVT